MPIAINGSGTITGLSTGGLPDGVVDADTLATDAVTTVKIQDDAVTDAKENLSGTAKAWVNFNGTGTVAIRASYNVSSITDNGAGDYTVNFTTAMSDANYSCVGASGGQASTSNGAVYLYDQTTARTTALIRLLVITTAGAGVDTPQVNVAIFR